MGLVFRKSIKLCKGVKLNLSKSGASLSFGTRGLRHTVSTSGKKTTTVGIPGTGVYYTKTSGSKKKASSKARTEEKKQQTKKKQMPDAQLEQNRQAVLQYEERISAVTSIHKGCDERVDWEKLYHSPTGFELTNAGALKKLSILQQRNKTTIEKSEILSLLAERVVSGDIDSYLYLIDEMKPFDDLLEYGSDFEVGTDDPDCMYVEFHVMSDRVIPETELSLTQTGRMSEKALSKTARYDLMQDYICSAAIRIARDLLALLPVSRVVIHAVDDMLNTSTGHKEEVAVLAVVIDRDTLDSLNLDYVDPSDALNNFRCNMKFVKTQGLKPVERIRV